MGLEAATYVNDLVTSNPVGASDPASQGDDHIRLMKTVLKATFPDASKPFYLPKSSSKATGDSPVSVAATAAGTTYHCDVSGGSITFSIAAISGFQDGDVLAFKKDGGSNTVTLDPNAAETIDNAATFVMSADMEFVKIQKVGSEWFVISQTFAGESAASTTVAGIVELATTAETETGTDATRAVTPDSLHDMTTLSGAAWFLDEDTMASDSAIKVASQQSIKAYVDALNLGWTLGTETATTSGTTKDYTGIASNVVAILFEFDGCSHTGTSHFIVQLGDSGGFEIAGYTGGAVRVGGTVFTAAMSAGFTIYTTAATRTLHGHGLLTLEDAANNVWAWSATVWIGSTLLSVSGGTKALSGTLTQVRLTSESADTFDAGAFNIKTMVGA